MTQKQRIINDISNVLLEMLQVAHPKKAWEIGKEVEGKTVITFEHDGMAIYDPLASSCGRFELQFADAVSDYDLELSAVGAIDAVNKYLLSLQE